MALFYLLNLYKEKTKIKFPLNDIRNLEQDNQELHIPNYNYCGPGTKIITRLTTGSKPINELDKACKCHDLEYMLYDENPLLLKKSDAKLRRVANKIGGIAPRLVESVFSTKSLLEDLGIINPVNFAKKLSLKMPQEKRQRLSKALFQRYILGQNISLDEFIPNKNYK